MCVCVCVCVCVCTYTYKIIDFAYKGGNRTDFWCHKIKYLHLFYFFAKKTLYK